MKKLVMGVLAAAMLVTSGMSAFAADIKVSTAGAEYDVVIAYEGETKSTDVTEIFTELENLTDSKDIIEELSIKGNFDSSANVVLKLEIPEEKIAQGVTAVDYIDFTISDSDGNVLYEESDRVIGENSREIKLDTLAKGERDEVYNIRMSANDNITSADLVNSVSDIVWTIEIAKSEENAVSEKEPEKTITISVSDKTDKDTNLIANGTYALTGVGTCTITSADGKKTKFELSDDTSKAKIVTMKTGDKIVVEGPQEATIKFNNPSTVNAKVTNSKSNPKTGDNAPIGAVSAAALVALGVMVYTASNKRKED